MKRKKSSLMADQSFFNKNLQCSVLFLWNIYFFLFWVVSIIKKTKHESVCFCFINFQLFRNQMCILCIKLIEIIHRRTYIDISNDNFVFWLAGNLILRFCVLSPYAGTKPESFQLRSECVKLRKDSIKIGDSDQELKL